MPRVFGFCNRPSECSKQLPYGNQNSCCYLHDIVGLGDEGEVFFHRRHIGTERFKEQPGHRVKQLGDDTCHPIDDTLEYPV